MINCGVDIIEIERIKKAVENTPRFVEKVFSSAEMEYFIKSGERPETLAGFYAAKEAFVKYKKTGIRGLELSEISVEHDSLGAPFVLFRGERQKVSLSISHNKTSAVAVVCGESEGGWVRNAEMKALIPKRSIEAHKGNCGRLFVVAGSRGMTGAAYLAARGALRSGIGLVTIGTPESERHIIACMLPEAMTASLKDSNGVITEASIKTILEYANKADSVVFGPGLGQNGDMHSILKTLLSEYKGKLVIDADGLNALSKNCDILGGKACEVVITPHPGEMSRLTRLSTEEVQQNRVVVAAAFAKKYGITVLLKGNETVIADGSGKVKINPTGNPGMATGGTGDVLSGVVGAFLGQGLKTFDAAVLGAYIHGKAGDMAAEKFGIYGLVAGDVADYTAFAIADELEN